MVSSLCFGLTQFRLTQQVKRHRRDVRNIGKEALWESDLMKETAGQRASGFDATAGLPTALTGWKVPPGKAGGPTAMRTMPPPWEVRYEMAGTRPEGAAQSVHSCRFGRRGDDRACLARRHGALALDGTAAGAASIQA